MLIIFEFIIQFVDFLVDVPFSGTIMRDVSIFYCDGGVVFVDFSNTNKWL